MILLLYFESVPKSKVNRLMNFFSFGLKTKIPASDPHQITSFTSVIHLKFKISDELLLAELSIKFKGIE